jgi:hypothetical protein
MTSVEFPVAYFFHSDDTLSKRKKVFDQYAKRFEIHLFKLDGDRNTAKICYLGRSEEEYTKADGLFIGNNL